MHVHRLEFPNSPQKGDAADFLAAGSVADDVLTLMAEAPEYEVDESVLGGRGNGTHRTSVGASDLTSFQFTDYGNAERLVALYGQDLHFIYAWGLWLRWDGRRWAMDVTGEVVRRAKATIRALFDQAVARYNAAAQALKAAANKNDQRTAVSAMKRAEATMRWAKTSEAAPRIAAMIELARSEPGIPITTDELDADVWALNVLNGTVDLRTGKLREHSRENLITKLAPVDYDVEAPCPIFVQFLDRIFDAQEDLIAFVQRAIGYSLTGDVGEQVLFFLHGLGANGKSTLLNIILFVLGDYAMRAVPELLLVTNTDRHPTERADLFGARFVASIELEAGKQLAEVLVKDLTGGDKMKARYLYHDFFSWWPTHKLFLAANHKPVIKGTDNAIWRRILLIPFTVMIPPAERDRQLGSKLQVEAAGILRWAIEGCLEWQKDGLAAPTAVKQATEAYRDESDILAEFIDAECVLEPDAVTPVSDLYSAYEVWCEQVKDKPITKTTFGTRLEERGLERTRTKRMRLWRGIRLRTIDDHEGDKGDGSDTEPEKLADARERVIPNLLETASPVSPTSPDPLPTCPTCGGTEWWYAPDGRLLCDVCHPQPGGAP